ncbi:hypothetical protein GYMLUDRAFT_246306 [Collybiopsis luxurians FD-317 M1]|uniref:Uncharacterized protein n=1 Tax=Collybiopsis luxurians FD-317 M1 TaxID=944289 RepID=A0A0D0BSF3_9AGAR|nr:hypothetical protein GYMLUDRAFT_246306 [Collybiopsis luxurians FD-317 M1]
MPVTTPTLLPRPQLFPRLLPDAPPVKPMPLPKGPSVNVSGNANENESERTYVGYGHMNRWRNLQAEMDELSDEETQMEELGLAVQHRGFSFLVPIGKTLTVMEEKNDADEDESEESASAASGGPPSIMEDEGEGDNESTQDLDASMEDLDEEGQNSDEEMNEGETEELDEGPSDSFG